MKTTLLVVFAYVSLVAGEDMVGLIIGGFGGGDSVELITKDRICAGNLATPNIPSAPGGNIFGWSAALLSGGGRQEEIILCGGKIEGESKLCHSLALGGKDWVAGKCEMSRERIYSSMFSTNTGQVVLSGGYSSRVGWLKDLDILQDITEDCSQDCCAWDQSFTTIPGRGIYAHCSVQFDENTVFVIGGNTWDTEVGQYDIGDVWKLNLQTKEWTQVASLKEPRQSMGCIKTTHNGKEGIMVAGGYCDNNMESPEALENCHQQNLASSIFYDVASDTWEDLAPMNLEREGLALLEVEGTIMAVGGGNRGTLQSLVEVWDGTKWEVSDLKLNTARRAFAFVSVPKSAYFCP